LLRRTIPYQTINVVHGLLASSLSCRGWAAAGAPQICWSTVCASSTDCALASSGEHKAAAYRKNARGQCRRGRPHAFSSSLSIRVCKTLSVAINGCLPIRARFTVLLCINFRDRLKLPHLRITGFPTPRCYGMFAAHMAVNRCTVPSGGPVNFNLCVHRLNSTT
jgi:hypothetical protein